MEIYTTESQQLEHFKSWWNKYGIVIVGAILIAAALSFAWRYWVKRQTGMLEHASMRYEQLLTSAANDDTEEVNEHATRLLTHYANTPYAQLAALMLARQAVYQNQPGEALARLQWVMEHGHNTALKQVARLRSARVLLAQHQNEKALKLLQTVDEASYQAAIEEIKGDIYMSEGKIALARAAYTKALQAMPDMENKQPLLRMKLDDLPSV